MSASPERRLLFIVNVDWFFLSHRLPIALAAMGEGYEVHLACAVTEAASEVEAHGIIVHPLALGRRELSPAAAAKSIGAIVRLLRKLRPDIVHLVTIKPVLFGGIAARATRTKRVVAAISGMGFVFISTGAAARARRMLVALLYRLALGWRNVIAIFQNDADVALVSSLAGLKPEQVRIIPGSGVDLERFAPAPFPPGRPVVVLASRLLVDKGLREFVGAARLLRSQGLDAKFVVAGDPDPGNPASIDPAELTKWRKDGDVELVGHCGDIAGLFARAHVVVLPSYREGMPKVLLEAAAAGRPVVTTDVPGCRDAVIPEKTGLVAPARSVEPLAEAIRRLVEDGELRERMGVAGRKLAEERFGVEQVVDAHLKLYAELMERVS